MEQPFSHKAGWIGSIFVPISSPMVSLVRIIKLYPSLSVTPGKVLSLHKVNNRGRTGMTRQQQSCREIGQNDISRPYANSTPNYVIMTYSHQTTNSNTVRNPLRCIINLITHNPVETRVLTEFGRCSSFFYFPKNCFGTAFASH